MKTYTPRRIEPLFDSFCRGLVLCVVVCACIWNSYGMIYKNAEMQYKQIGDTINVNQTLTNYGN